MTSHGDLKTMNRNVMLTPTSFLIYARRFPPGRWSFLGPVDQKQSGILLTTKDHRENGTESMNWWWSNSEKSGHPVFRATGPLSRGTLKSKGGWKLSFHFCADGGTTGNCFFAKSFLLISWVSTEQSQICVTNANPAMLEQWRPVLESDALFEPATLLITTPTTSTEDPAREDLLQKYQERVERLSQQNRVIKICTDAGFLTTVEVGQYFMTKDTEEFSPFTEPVACREYTLPRDEKSSDPKVWIRGNT